MGIEGQRVVIVSERIDEAFAQHGAEVVIGDGRARLAGGPSEEGDSLGTTLWVGCGARHGLSYLQFLVVNLCAVAIHVEVYPHLVARRGKRGGDDAGSAWCLIANRPGRIGAVHRHANFCKRDVLSVSVVIRHAGDAEIGIGCDIHQSSLSLHGAPSGR